MGYFGRYCNSGTTMPTAVCPSVKTAVTVPAALKMSRPATRGHPLDRAPARGGLPEFPEGVPSSELSMLSGCLAFVVVHAMWTEALTGLRVAARRPVACSRRPSTAFQRFEKMLTHRTDAPAPP